LVNIVGRTIRLADVLFYRNKESTPWEIKRVLNETLGNELIECEMINSKVSFQKFNKGDSFMSVLFAPTRSSK